MSGPADTPAASRLACMLASVHEDGITVAGEMAFAPAQDGRLLHLKLSADTIELRGSQPSPIRWAIQVNLGLVRSPTMLHWVSLTPTGRAGGGF
ncbi:hypothetical protein [Cupriavidus basilensis]|uniref:hypothetical protein n=1 Tax=Cupriavidus basilensis TaxID=68895 RepID=UPI0039F6C64C